MTNDSNVETPGQLLERLALAEKAERPEDYVVESDGSRLLAAIERIKHHERVVEYLEAKLERAREREAIRSESIKQAT